MISFGGGVNSVAMTIMLVNEGWRGPIVFADTGGEHPETYCYLRTFGDWLKEREMEITTIGAEWRGKRYAESLYDLCFSHGIIPLLAVRWCSFEYKRNPLHAWAEAHGITTQLIGISSDEPRRVREMTYPLVERDINREECQRIIQRAGLPIPRKSGCFFCPGQRLDGWRDLFLHYPDLYERAAALERRASEHYGRDACLRIGGPCLDEIGKRRWEGQMEMDLSDWIPCVCTL